MEAMSKHAVFGYNWLGPICCQSIVIACLCKGLL